MKTLVQFARVNDEVCLAHAWAETKQEVSIFNYDDRLETSFYSIQVEIPGHELNAAGCTHVS